MRLSLPSIVSRRALLAALSAFAASSPSNGAELLFTDSSTQPGFSFAEAKLGKGVAPTAGQRVAIDYVMSTTGARYGAKIDSTVDRQQPYRWTLGDGTTIEGLELAILGDGANVPPMMPGGVRRVIIPSKLAYADKAIPNKNSLQLQDCSTGKGPVPPNAPSSSKDMGAGEFRKCPGERASKLWRPAPPCVYA